MEATLGLPAKGMAAVHFGLQVDHRAGPVEAPEQRLELLDPQAPLVFDGLVAGTEVDDLGLVEPGPGLLAAAEHLASEERPGLAARQAVQHAAVGGTTHAPLHRIARPVADAAIDDGFRLHRGTPEQNGLAEAAF